MGKIRRVRQKFHQNISKDKPNVSLDSSTEGNSEYHLTGKSPLLKTPEEFAAIPDNLFQGIDINLDNLKTKLEDDRISVRSVAKSCKYDSKGKLLTKKEKQKLKHDLFMRKINTVEQLKKEALQKHKKRKGLNKSDIKTDNLIKQPVVNSQIESKNGKSCSNLDTSKKEVKKVKSGGIKKSKVRQREMLQDITAFRKMLSDPTFSKDPCSTISETIQERIMKEMTESKLRHVSEKEKKQ